VKVKAIESVSKKRTTGQVGPPNNDQVPNGRKLWTGKRLQRFSPPQETRSCEYHRKITNQERHLCGGERPPKKQGRTEPVKKGLGPDLKSERGVSLPGKMGHGGKTYKQLLHNLGKGASLKKG